jgi:hypothetical protein
MRFLEGFDKTEIVLGTSVFYIAALILVCISLVLSPSSSGKKSDGFHKQSNLENSFPVLSQKARMTSYEVSLGFGSTIELDEEVTIDIVAARITTIMQNRDLDAVEFEFNCSRVDCWVEFSITDLEKRELAKLANDQFNDIWYQQITDMTRE